MICYIFPILLLFFYFSYHGIIFIYNSYIPNKQIYFLDKFQLSNYLSKDPDNFYENLNIINLQSRNINNKDMFLNNLHLYCYTFTKQETKILIKTINDVNKKLDNLNYIGFNNFNNKKIPWIIGSSIGNNYEYGLPHTRNNIIILNKEMFDSIVYNKIELMKLLIHERIHVYQKMFPNDINDFLQNNNFIPIKYFNNDNRANPDTNNIIYQKNNIIYECKFNINNNLLYCTNNSYYNEHPYEYMAYEIAELCFKNLHQ